MASPDYEEFIAALNDNGVRYLIVGAHAVAFHARPRATKDLDILLDSAPKNARKAQAALRDYRGLPVHQARDRAIGDCRHHRPIAMKLGMAENL